MTYQITPFSISTVFSIFKPTKQLLSQQKKKANQVLASTPQQLSSINSLTHTQTPSLPLTKHIRYKSLTKPTKPNHHHFIKMAWKPPGPIQVFHSCVLQAVEVLHTCPVQGVKTSQPALERGIQIFHSCNVSANMDRA